MTIDEIPLQAMLLPPHERELLVVDLLGSLDSLVEQGENDALWHEEVMARSDAYRSGTAVTFDAQESLDRVRAQLAARTAS